MRTTVPPVAARVSAGPDVLDWVRGLVSLVFVLLLPLLIIGTSLRGLVTDRELMLRGFRDNQVATTTGLDDPQLQRIADAFVAYFQGPPGQIQMQVTAFGQSRPLFNDKEVAHMEDVQSLIQFFLRMQIVAAAAVVLRLAVAIVSDRATAPIGRELLWSTGLMVALVVLVGVLSLMDFDALWTRFHQIAFRNDLWQLDPTRDYLIMLFPEPFWFTATLRMATTVALQTVVVAVVGVVLLLPISIPFTGSRSTVAIRRPR
jgi:integral membrane protein (TIGR01906 family)